VTVAIIGLIAAIMHIEAYTHVHSRWIPM